MKASDAFTKVINSHLQAVAEQDALFAVTLKKPKKNITDCIIYIMNTVKASGCTVVTDDEVFNMAVHYYDEDDITVGAPIKGKVVVSGSANIPATDKRTPKVEVKVEPKKALKKQFVVENQPSLF